MISFLHIRFGADIVPSETVSSNNYSYLLEYTKLRIEKYISEYYPSFCKEINDNFQECFKKIDYGINSDYIENEYFEMGFYCNKNLITLWIKDQYEEYLEFHLQKDVPFIEI